MNHQETQKTAQRERGIDLPAIRTDRWLRQLPGRRAPTTLVPRVLAELARRAQLAWYRRPWTDWPEVMRWLSMLALGTAVSGAIRLCETGSQVAAAKAPPVFAAVGEVPLYLQVAESTGRAILGMVHSMPQMWLLTVVALLGAVVAGTIGLGTAAWRLARSSTH